MRKRLLSRLLVFTMLLSLFPAQTLAYAAGSPRLVSVNNTYYTVTYDSGPVFDDGDYEIESDTKVSSGSYQLKDAGYFSRQPDGYRLLGWTRYSQTYDAGSTYTITGDATFYANWQRTYTVTFDTAYGAAPEIDPVDAGATLDLTNYQLTAEGHSFTGWAWYDGASYVNVGNSYMVNCDTTLVAQWEDAQQNVTIPLVTFDAGRGTGTMDAVTENVDSSYQLPESTFTPPEGGTFAGWGIAIHYGEDMVDYVSELCAAGELLSNVLYNRDQENIAEIHLTALYNGGMVPVTFEPGEGTGTMEPASVEWYDDFNYRLPKSGFTAPEGQEFRRWRVEMFRWDSDENGYENLLEPGRSIDWYGWNYDPAALTRIVVTATYATPVTITFDADGGSGTMEPQTGFAGDWFYVPGCEFTAPDGKIFGYWDVNGLHYLRNGHILLEQNITVKAVWWDKDNLPTFTVSFDMGEDVETVDPVVVPGGMYTPPVSGFTPPDTGLVVAGWRIEHDGPNTEWVRAGDGFWLHENATLHAEWAEGTIVHFDANGGTGSMDDIVRARGYGSDFDLPECDFVPADGKMFAYWQVEDENYLPGDWYYIGSYQADWPAELTVKAVWWDKENRPMVTVHFVDSGDGSGTMEDVQVPAETAYELPECGFTAPEGMAFAGWEVEDGLAIFADDGIYLYTDTTLRAEWYNPADSSQAVTIRFAKGSGGTGEMDSVTVPLRSDYTLPENGFEAADGKVFRGWYVSYRADEEIDDAASYAYAPGELFYVDPYFYYHSGDETPELIVTALWWDEAQLSDLTYTVNFRSSSSSVTNEMDPVKVKAGELFTFPENGFQRRDDGYDVVFTGWWYNDKIYQPGDTVRMISNMDVYAGWSDAYVARFDGNGGSGSMDNVLVPRGSWLVLPENQFTPADGFAFRCWLVGGKEFAPGDKYPIPRGMFTSVTARALWQKAAPIDTTGAVQIVPVVDGETGEVSFPVDGGDITAALNQSAQVTLNLKSSENVNPAEAGETKASARLAPSAVSKLAGAEAKDGEEPGTTLAFDTVSVMLPQVAMQQILAGLTGEDGNTSTAVVKVDTSATPDGAQSLVENSADVSAEEAKAVKDAGQVPLAAISVSIEDLLGASVSVTGLSKPIVITFFIGLNIPSFQHRNPVIRWTRQYTDGGTRLGADSYDPATGMLSFETTHLSDFVLTVDESTTWTATFDPNGGTLASGASATQTFARGDAITLPGATRSGYSFSGWYNGSTLAGAAGASYTPTADVTLTARWTTSGGRRSSGGGGSSSGGVVSANSNIKVANNVGGKVTNVSGGSATIVPDAGWFVLSVTVNGKAVELPRDNVLTGLNTTDQVVVTFGQSQPVTFRDVVSGSFYADAVQWAVDHRVTNGTSADTFSPDASCTRAEMVTFLWRSAGCPAPSAGAASFSDVPADAFYHDAVLWASEKNITKGTGDGQFSPLATVTRGEAVTFLHRFAKTPAGGSNSFSDVAPDAFYADAVNWAAGTGITLGTGGGQFSPAGDCVRCQIVTFLYRYAAK